MAKAAEKSAASKPKPAARAPNRRSLWHGQLRLSLVSVPIELFPATQAGARIAFHQIDTKTGKRIHYQKVADGVGKVPDERIAKAIEVKRGEYVVFDDDDLESVKQTGKRMIDLVQFVKSTEIEPIWYDKPYYVVPADEMAEDAFNVLRDALRASGMIGLGQFVMRGRDTVAAIKPCGRGMILETLHFSDEVRKAAPFFAEIVDEKPDQELLDLARELISRKTAKFEPENFVDHYSDELRAMIAQKSEAHQEVHVEDEEKPKSGGQVINLVEALRRSVAQNSKTDTKDDGGKAKTKRRT
jgi:DNA end-binding protein Ku